MYKKGGYIPANNGEPPHLLMDPGLSTSPNCNALQLCYMHRVSCLFKVFKINLIHYHYWQSKTISSSNSILHFYTILIFYYLQSKPKSKILYPLVFLYFFNQKNLLTTFYNVSHYDTMFILIIMVLLLFYSSCLRVNCFTNS